jgi:protein involved in polysaccharide export with SLBB domain
MGFLSKVKTRNFPPWIGMKSTTSFFAFLGFGLMTALAGGTPVFAQSDASAIDDRHNFETRSALETQAQKADASGDKATAYRARYRLEHGDFKEGDRVIVKVQGPGGFSDTTIVRSGKNLQLPQMAPLSLEGVLRSELSPRLTAFVGKYLREPVVQTTPLVRVGILGSVSRPGYYYVAADLPLSDVLMSAGGPSSDADINEVSIRRDGQVIVDQSNTRTALSEGMSLDMLGLQAGDEVSIEKERRFNWGVIIPTITGVLGLLVAFTQIHH